MKNLLLSAAFILLFVAGINAQGRFSVKNRVDQMKQRLSLTDEQAAKVDSILTVQMDQARNLDVTGSERRDAMRKIMADSNAKIDSLLTDTQRVEFQKMLDERRNRMQNRPPRDGNN